MNATHFDSSSYLSAALIVHSPSCKYPAAVFLHQNTITASISLQINNAKQSIWSIYYMKNPVSGQTEYFQSIVVHLICLKKEW